MHARVAAEVTRPHFLRPLLRMRFRFLIPAFPISLNPLFVLRSGRDSSRYLPGQVEIAQDSSTQTCSPTRLEFTYLDLSGPISPKSTISETPSVLSFLRVQKLRRSGITELAIVCKSAGWCWEQRDRSKRLLCSSRLSRR